MFTQVWGKKAHTIYYSVLASPPLFLLFPSSLLVVANLSLLPLNFHLGKKVFCRATKIPKYRGKLTKQDSPAQTVPNKHDKKDLPFTQPKALFANFT